MKRYTISGHKALNIARYKLYLEINLVPLHLLRSLALNRNRFGTIDGDVIMLLGDRFGVRYDRRDCGKSNSLTLFRGPARTIDRRADRRWFDRAFRISQAIPEFPSRGVSTRTSNVVVSSAANSRKK